MNILYKTILSVFVMTMPLLGAELPEALQVHANESVVRGLDWLLTQQNEKGYFGIPDAPAITGLCVIAMSYSDEMRESPAFNRAVDWIISTARPDGGFYVMPSQTRRGGGRATYNTGICMMALHLSGRPDARPYVLAARKFVAAGQRAEQDSSSYGGFGYDLMGMSDYADMSNTYVAVQAMALTEEAEDLREGEQVDFNKEAAAEFISHMQHAPQSNPGSWVMTDDENRGGFTYHVPENNRELGTKEKVKLSAYGSMTYAGIMSLLYCDVDRSDPRIRSAFDWASRHWTVDENPGVGTQGYFYFLNILSKCMATIQDDVLIAQDGTVIPWREEMIQKLVDLQLEDGTWKNEDNRYWEGNPILVTAYTLTALEILLSDGE
ncbi:terpene cyclase/mutase family protein [Kiritimatiellota bacterium B12222]|nr:terpene cyclase/mutase family protein [Kiritimatiellota bacterium B12222]